MSTHPVPPRYLWWLVGGFAIWASAHVSLYAIHGLGCEFAWAAWSVRLALVLVLLAYLTVLAWMWRVLGPSLQGPDAGATAGFLHTVAVWTVAAAFATTALTLAPPLFLTGCT